MSSYTLNVGAELVSLFFLSFSAFSDTNLKSMPGKWVMEVLLIFWPFQVRYEFEGERGRKRQAAKKFFPEAHASTYFQHNPALKLCSKIVPVSFPLPVERWFGALGRELRKARKQRSSISCSGCSNHMQGEGWS